MTSPDGAPPVASDQVFTFTNPARTISVSTAYDGHAVDVRLTDAALKNSEAELAKQIVAAAKFSRDRSRAALANDLVKNSVARGDNEDECRLYIHRVQHFPTDTDVESEIAAHYGLSGQDGAGAVESA